MTSDFYPAVAILAQIDIEMKFSYLALVAVLVKHKAKGCTQVSLGIRTDEDVRSLSLSEATSRI